MQASDFLTLDKSPTEAASDLYGHASLFAFAAIFPITLCQPLYFTNQ